jgi:hypothetical protein
MSDAWRRAVETGPPVTYEVPRGIDRQADEITLHLDDRAFRMPSSTRFYRVGKTQEGLLVEYQATDGTWESAEEVTG